ncbi:MAG: hypothetical protein C9356_09385 [Oleiphilus sp.]|nr:MAG: hypothetical protein C9356_09385 [Oleiphilus sp.]
MSRALGGKPNIGRFKAFLIVAICTFFLTLTLQAAFFGLGGAGHLARLLGTATAPLILGLPALTHKKNPLVSYGITVIVLIALMMYGNAGK